MKRIVSLLWLALLPVQLQAEQSATVAGIKGDVYYCHVLHGPRKHQPSHWLVQRDG